MLAVPTLLVAVALSGLCETCLSNCTACRSKLSDFCSPCQPCYPCWPGLHTVSGFSNGGSMAVVHHVVYSQTSYGAGVVAGAPYGCQTVPNAPTSCTKPPSGFDWASYLPGLNAYVNTQALHSLIDAPSHLDKNRAWLFSGSNDTVLYPSVVKALASQYQSFGVAPAEVFTLPAENAWIVNDTRAQPCAHLGAPYLNNCNFDLSHAMLTHLMVGRLEPPTPEASLSQLVVIDAAPYMASTAASNTLARCFYAYVPAGCAASPSYCKLHVHYHDCGGDGPAPWGTPMTRALGTLEGLAEANNIIIVYPQAKRTSTNPLACWDVYGSMTGSNFNTQDGAQLFTVAALLGDLQKALSRPAPSTC